MRFESAPGHAAKEDLALVRACAAQIHPDENGRSDWSWYFPTYSSHHESRIALDLEIIERNVERTREIWEIGSIPPLLTLALAKRGWRVTGLDLDPSRFQTAIKEHALQVVQCDIERSDLPLRDGACQVVVFNEVFEHLRFNPIHTLSEIRRVLAPDGQLLLSTPNLRSLEGLYNMIFRNRGYAMCGEIYDEYSKLERHGHMGHVREYTTGEICAFLDKVGFEVDAVIYRGTAARWTWLKNAALHVLPQLRPFASYIAHPA